MYLEGKYIMQNTPHILNSVYEEKKGLNNLKLVFFLYHCFLLGSRSVVHMFECRYNHTYIDNHDRSIHLDMGKSSYVQMTRCTL